MYAIFESEDKSIFLTHLNIPFWGKPTIIQSVPILDFDKTKLANLFIVGEKIIAIYNNKIFEIDQSNLNILSE